MMMMMTSDAHTLLHIVNSVLLTLLIVGMIVLFHERSLSKRVRGTGAAPPVFKEGSKSCEAIDPVSDPTYNMKEICKQLILLEEHLSIKSKYCSDCIRKHFLHCIGLAEEAVMLSCAYKDKQGGASDIYQHVIDTLKVCFGSWIDQCKSYDDSAIRLEIVSKLRTLRKKMVNHYFS
jgi:hypothetical protein